MTSNPAMTAPVGRARLAKRDYTSGIALAIIHLGALGIFIPALFSWSAVAVGVLLYLITGFGITLSFHRQLTHRSLTLWKPFEYLAAVCGTLALQGGPIDWVATHRAHHAYTDADGDPHDSHRGMAWAHIEWLFRSNKDRVAPEERPRWAADLIADPVYVQMEKYHFIMQLVLMGLLFAIGGWSWVIWGIFARLTFTYHCTWLVNSACHAVGYQTYKSGDRSTNNWLVAMLAFGEGWHNNHHAFPFSASHGLKRSEFDMTFIMIRALEKVKIARNVKLPTREMKERMRLPKAIRLGG